jgi:hypothetical protein
MHDFACEQSVFWRRVGFVFQDASRGGRLTRSYQYMSDRTMYDGNPASGY